MAISTFPMFPFAGFFFSFTSDLKINIFSKELEQISCFLFKQELFISALLLTFSFCYAHNALS